VNAKTFRWFGISATRGSKDKGEGTLHRDSLNLKTPKEQVPRHFSTLEIRTPKEQGSPLYSDFAKCEMSEINVAVDPREI
jgi:hypothetical protein